MHHDIDEVATIATAAQRVSDLARTCDLTTPVTHLGRWKIRDVIAHLGGVHRWATRVITTRSIDGPGFRKSRLDGNELCDWFDTGVVELLDALRSNPADGSCPNFNPGSPTTVRWWSRRQMHETVVHRWDVERPLDWTTPIPDEVAADGIDEFLDTFVRTRGKQTLIAPLRLTTTHPARTWTLVPSKRPGRIDITAGSRSNEDAAITGSPADLLLHLWGRHELHAADLTVTGNHDIAASLRNER